MTRKLIFSLSILFLPAFIIQVAAQTAPFFIEKLTTAEGLSSNKVNDIAEDDNGFLWIATSDGLNRFDGTEVIQYYYSDSVHSLPHNYVNCLKKLAGNYLAIGTEGGLSFYNGNTSTFNNFYYDKNKPFREFDNTIVDLEVDVKGNLWAASRNSIYIFDSTLKLTKVLKSTFTEADAARKRIRYVDKMIPLSNGDMLLCVFDGWYIGSANADALTRLEQSNLKFQLDFVREASTRITGEKFEMYFPYSHLFKIFDKYLVCLKPDQDSLLLMDEKGRQLGACFFPYNRYPYILWSQILTAIDSTHLLFLLHNFGLCSVPVVWKNGEPSLQAMSPLMFESSEYDKAVCDRQGNWWLATTEAGLQKISPYKQVFKSTPLMDAVTHDRIKYELNFLGKYSNALWLSTYGEGFFNIDLSTGKQRQFHLRKTDNDLWANFIWNIRQTSSDSLWVGTQEGLFWFKISNQHCGRIANYPGKPALIDSVAITTQFSDSHGLIWMGLGRGKGVCYFDSHNKKFTYFPGNSKEYPLRYPVGMAEDTHGDLWFTNDATATLLKWERKTGKFQTILLPLKPNDRISNLYGIYCDGDSVCWLGTVTSGLVKYNISKNTVSVFGHENGLINSHIRSIFPDNAKRWWLVTEGGLSCFDPLTNSFFNFSENDGLPVRFPTTPFYYDEQANRLYSGGKGIFFYFDPMKMNTSLPPQKTIITAVEVNGKTAMFIPGASMTLQSNQDDITIHYAAIDFNNGRQTKYVYKLMGKDTSWIMAGYQRQINFSHLAPGHYQFFVCSQNNQGILSAQQASIRFYIDPPFTQTAWFYGMIVLAIAGMFYGLYRFRLRQLLRTEQIRNEISKNLHDELGSTLTNISLGSLLIQKQIEPEGTVKRLLDRIYQDSQAVSQTMREIVWSINPKIDTMGEALPRMLQYASEMLEAKNIELEAEIAPEIEQVKLNMEQRRDLYLIFKEAVNNLARHSEASRAHISFIREDTSLVMTIADNGRGIVKTGSRMGNGLKNMKERALGHRWFLVLDSHAGMGTTLTVKAKIA